MNLPEIKKVLGVETINLFAHVDTRDPQNPKETPWLTSWDNTNRVRLVVHKDVLAQIKANPMMPNLALKTEQKISTESKLPYTYHDLIAVKEADVVL